MVDRSSVEAFERPELACALLGSFDSPHIYARVRIPWVWEPSIQSDNFSINMRHTEITTYLYPPRVARLRHRLTQRDVARAALVSQVTVCKVETGRLTPRPLTRRALADALGYAESDLFVPFGEPSPNAELRAWAAALSAREGRAAS